MVLERGEVANSWRRERWDSLRLLTPNWQCRLPGYPYDGADPDGFMTMPELIERISGFAAATSAPVRTHTTVTSVSRVDGGYRVATDRLPSFSQLSDGPRPATFAAIPLLVVSAPFLIMRNTILGRRLEGRRFEFVFLATLIAGFWSLMSGLVLVMTLQACGFLLA